MLRDTARRLLNMTSPNETVARVASDEFAILVKPAASRTDSAELYLLATGFRGAAK